MKHKLLVIIPAIIVCLCGCSLSNTNEVEEVTEGSTVTEELTEVEPTEIETESTEEGESSVEESSVVEEIIEDEITYYNYGYDIPSDINVAVVDNKVQISTEANGPDFYNDKFDVYYWTDRNTKIFDSTSREVKQGTPALIFSKDNFKGNWNYVWMIGEDGVIMESSYQFRVLEISFIKNGEQYTEKYILCCPKGVIFFNNTLDSNKEFTNVLDIKCRDGSIRLNLNDLVLNHSADYVEVVCEQYKALVISYESLIGSYENYTKLVEFYTESKVGDESNYSIQVPLDAATLNETLLSNLTINVQKYIDSVLAGIKYYYLILNIDNGTYEIIVSSNIDIDIYNLRFGDSLFGEDGTYKYEDEDLKIAWCLYEDFINNEEINDSIISYVFE